MPKFTLVINLGNEGMQEGWQIRDALLKVAKAVDGVHSDYMARCQPQKIRDINGNVVGHYEVV